MDEQRQTHAEAVDRSVDRLEELVKDLHDGGSDIAHVVYPLVARELKSLARVHMRRERNDHTLQATALVNEAWLRIFKDQARGPEFDSVRHFLVCCSVAMRRVLIEHSRARNMQKRTPPGERSLLDDVVDGYSENTLQLLEYDELVDSLRELNELAWEVTQLHVIIGLTFAEIASVLSLPVPRVKVAWGVARRVLKGRLK